MSSQKNTSSRLLETGRHTCQNGWFSWSGLFPQTQKQASPKLHRVTSIDTTTWGMQPSTMCPPLVRMWVGLFLIICLWLCLSIAFFHTYEEWTLTEAFFFVSNVGLGVGYGFPMCKTLLGKAATMLHVIVVVLNSSVIAICPFYF